MTPSTQARDRYLAEYRRFMENGGAGGPPWLRQLRERAIQSFDAAGFPTTKDEAWRFTNIAPVLAAPFRFDAAKGRVAAKTLAGLTVGGGARLVFANGRFHPKLSRVAGLPPGVRFGSLALTLQERPELVEPHLAQMVAVEGDPFAALATAFLQDGAFLHVPAGVELTDPLEVVFLSAPGRGGHVTHLRTLAVVERGAGAVLVERYAGLDDGAYFNNVVTEVVVGDGAGIDLCRIQQESPGAFHIAASRTRQGRDARVASCVVATGAALARHDLGAVMAGPGGSLTLNGLVLARARQHIDHQTVIDHAEPHCESHELFNGVFDDAARGVFTGRIVVRPGAQRTDSKQTNNNLLLSENARADSQPQLEIYADDVKCTHGATLGPVDQASLFYLRSRGLGLREARELLTYGFGADIVTRVRPPAVRAHLDDLLVRRLRTWDSPS